MNSDLQDELAGLRATFHRLQLEHADAKELPDEGACLHLLRLRCWLDAVELFRLKFLAPEISAAEPLAVNDGGSSL